MTKFGLDQVQRFRLRAIVHKTGTNAAVAKAAGIPPATFHQIMTGEGDVGVSRLARIAEVCGVTVDTILTGRDPSEQFEPVPIINTAVSAGGGALVLEDGVTSEMLGFPREWLRSKFELISGLRVVKIRGDSMIPTLREGDWLMIDMHRREPVDGIWVVRLGDAALVKRVQFQGATIRLTSDNPVYSETVVDHEAEGDGFGVIGRAVWSGGMI